MRATRGASRRNGSSQDSGAQMSEQSKNSQAGHAPLAYPLAALTRALPTLAALQSFVAAAQLGSLSKAAAHLFLSLINIAEPTRQAEKSHAGVVV